jgi:hypothetical protein
MQEIRGTRQRFVVLLLIFFWDMVLYMLSRRHLLVLPQSGK